MKYIDADKLIKAIEEKGLDCSFASKMERLDTLALIDSLQQEQPDTCIFGNTPSESSCKFCGVECALREPKQTGTTSAGLSSKDEAIGLAIMAYLDTKVKHDNAKVCGISLKIAREWIREKIANKQEQPEVSVECYARVYPTLDNKPRPWVSLCKHGISLNSIRDIPELESLGFKDGDTVIVTIKKK